MVKMTVKKSSSAASLEAQSHFAIQGLPDAPYATVDPIGNDSPGQITWATTVVTTEPRCSLTAITTRAAGFDGRPYIVSCNSTRPAENSNATISTH